MTEENEHIEQLKAARKSAVAQRRDFAKALAVPYRRGHTESMLQVFVDVQSAIEAIDRAIKDEQTISGRPPAGMSDGARTRQRK